MAASATGQLEVVKYLIDQGADVNDLSRYGNTVLSYAIDNRHINIDVVKFLIESNAEITINDIEIARKQNDEKLVKYLEAQYKKQK